MADVPYRRPPAEGGVRRVRAYARRENSEDSIEVLSTTDSIFPDDLTAITEEEAEPHLQSNGLDNEEEGQREGTPDAAEPGNDGVNDGPDARGAPGAAEGNGDVTGGEDVATCVKSSQDQEDKSTRMSNIWRGSENQRRVFRTISRTSQKMNHGEEEKTYISRTGL